METIFPHVPEIFKHKSVPHLLWPSFVLFPISFQSQLGVHSPIFIFMFYAFIQIKSRLYFIYSTRSGFILPFPTSYSISLDQIYDGRKQYIFPGSSRERGKKIIIFSFCVSLEEPSLPLYGNVFFV